MFNLKKSKINHLPVDDSLFIVFIRIKFILHVRLHLLLHDVNVR